MTTAAGVTGRLLDLFLGHLLFVMVCSGLSHSKCEWEELLSLFMDGVLSRGNS
jgi:hypothetical protein